MYKRQEADVEEALNSLAEQIAEFTPVDRAAKKDDVAIIDFKTTPVSYTHLDVYKRQGSAGLHPQ